MNRKFSAILVLAIIIIGFTFYFQEPAEIIDKIDIRPAFEHQFSYPVEIQGHDDFLYILEKKGIVKQINLSNNSISTVLDIETRVYSASSEMGLLGIAIHPLNSSRIFLNYIEITGSRTIIAEFIMNQIIDPNSERIILEIEQPYSNHNGGKLDFGPDGYLYIGVGDGGSGGDPHFHGQNKETLLGSLLRIDVDNELPYAIPSDNPFVGIDGRDEIYAYGLRNPWKFSFDNNGLLWLADVGQNAYEEVNLITKGGNYGWNQYEGTNCFFSCNPTGKIMPIFEYSHNRLDAYFGNSVTGGYVYTGTAIPSLNDYYIFADYLSGFFWKLDKDGNGEVILNRSGLQIVSFGQDMLGEIYLALTNGTIMKMVNI